MSFDLKAWLQKQAPNYKLDIPLSDVSGKTADDEREWLITNGLGSYASASIWGANTRRYHGLFMAAVEPPVDRRLLFSRIDEVMDGAELSTNFWVSGHVSPAGFEKVVAFAVYPVPTWVFELPSGHLVKQVAMLPGRQEVVVGYTWLGQKSGELTLRLIANLRDFHGQTSGSPDWTFSQTMVESKRLRVKAYDSAPELTIAFDRGSYVAEPAWYWGYYWPRENERGLPVSEDAFSLGRIDVRLEPGQSITLAAGLEKEPFSGAITDAVSVVAAHQAELLTAAGDPADEDVKRLVLAADAFVVDRRSTGGKSIIAGYHWFNDWGRDSMISLAGLALSTGRTEVARSILDTFGKYASEGMLPNNFPDSGQKPAYNTSDATFWWGPAMLRYFRSTGDADFVRRQLPLMDTVVDWHLKGTRYNLRVDPADGLVTGGEPGVQLTWMDAKVGDFVVTPRQGKAVEINALWYNFLKALEELHAATGGDGSRYADLADKARAGFSAFWNADKGCLFDVIHDDGTRDASVRPNQLFAVSLPFPLLPAEKAKSVLAVVEQELLTPMGLRTLSPGDPAYQGCYGGGKAVANQYDRDVTYHQGTVWPWLLGAWVDARMKVHGMDEANSRLVATKLAGIRQHVLAQAGLGSISEIFDGDYPHKPRGCVAQAWSVAELLRVLTDYPRLR